MICSQNDIKFYKDFLLTNFNTLKIKSLAKLFYMPENTGELVSLLKKYKNQNPVVIGCGSNILFSSNGVDEPVIYTGRLDNITHSLNTLEVEAGVRTQTLSKYTLDRNYKGFEFLIGIPATVGGAIYMNAGAHGQNISENLISAKIYDKESGKILTLPKDKLEFSYRHSILQDKPYILLSAKFAIKKGLHDDIKNKMDENIIFRKNIQPSLSYPNTGSVFKNPPDCEFSAGALIDKCGFRNYSLGECEVWKNHCNFIVNKGNATSSDYINIIFEIFSKVKEKFNIELSSEIIYIGNMTDEEAEKWKIIKK